MRNLANRSAQAAREIKNLVENANKKADEGKKITDDMIKGYADLNENINSTINLINNVSQASNQQKIGIEQVNSALLLLENKTQENASIAQNTYSIATQTNTISKQIVSDSEEKEFAGKNEINESNYANLFVDTSLNKQKSIIEKRTNISSTPKHNIKEKIVHKQNITDSKVVTSNKNDDEWESF